jgi:glycyl-tRNA synthetase
MAEIEHFVDPLDKSHHKFDTVKDEILPLWTKGSQEELGAVTYDLTLG